MRLMIRGGQTLIHAFCMAWQVIQLLIAVAVLSWLLFIGANMWYQVPEPLSPWLIPWAKANFSHMIVPKHKIALTIGTQRLLVPSAAVLSYSKVKEVDRAIRKSIRLACYEAVILTILLLLGLMWRGYCLRQNKLLRGSYLGKPRQLQRAIAKQARLGQFSLATVRLPDPVWNQHVLVHGTTGMGKSVLLRDICDQIRRQGDRAIIYDQHAGFLPYYYREGRDKLLNPLDCRSQRWDLWQECKEIAHYQTLAKALIPTPNSKVDPFWTESAQTVWSAAARKMEGLPSEQRLEKLVQLLLTGSLEELHQLLKGTEAQSLILPKLEKVSLSIQSVVANYTKPLGLIQSKGEPFAIRDWITSSNDDSWLFITGREDFSTVLRPLLSMWLDQVASSVLSLPEQSAQRTWLIIDELASLHYLPSLTKLLAESRKFGGCLVLSTQNIFQLQEIYGSNESKSIIDLCNTRVFFRSGSDDSADWGSRQLGEGSWLEVQEGMSYGASRFRDGVNLTRQMVTRKAVPKDLLRHLPIGHAILQVPPGSTKRKKTIKRWPVAEIILPVKTQNRIAEDFVAAPKKEYVVPTEKLSEAQQNNHGGDASLQNSDSEKKMESQAKQCDVLERNSVDFSDE